MRMKQKELYNVIENLPGELSNKFVDYIKYLTTSNHLKTISENISGGLLVLPLVSFFRLYPPWHPC